VLIRYGSAFLLKLPAEIKTRNFHKTPRSSLSERSFPQNLIVTPGVQFSEPEFDHVPLVESHWSNTPEKWHSYRAFGVPGAFVTSNPPPSVRFTVVRWAKRPIVPPALRYRLEFVTHPPDVQSKSEE
jgi:hypothetical protein